MDLSAVYYAGEDTPAPHESQIIPTIILGWERQLTGKTNLNLQGYTSQSVYTEAETELEELLSDKFQLSLGVRHRFECCLMSFAITENLQNLNNTPDIGFQLGFAWVPKHQARALIGDRFIYCASRDRTWGGVPAMNSPAPALRGARTQRGGDRGVPPAATMAVALNSAIQARHCSAGSALQ